MPYFSSTGNVLFLDDCQITSFSKRTRQANAELRKFARFMSNGSHNQGSIYRFAPDSPLDLLNREAIQSVIYEGIEIPLPEINHLKADAYVVYDDSSIDRDQVIEILNIKAGLSHSITGLGPRSNLLTMMLPSYAYIFQPAAVNGAKLKIFNYTYLNFNYVDLSDNGIRQNIKQMIQLNLLSVSYEALRHKHLTPFIINPPGAFIRKLDEERQAFVARIISDSISEICNDSQIKAIMNKTISECIMLNPDFWKSRPIIPYLTHYVKADVLEIACKLLEKRGIYCPIPMMGDPLGAIGNGALGNHAESALDEFLFRVCGGIHGLLGNIHYNPGIRILPLSQVMGELNNMIYL